MPSPRLGTAAALLVAVLAGCLTGCTSVLDSTTSGSTQASVAQVPADIPGADAAAIRRSVDTFNDAAAGAVASQQAVLHSLVDPALSAGLDQCPAPTTTLRFEPVYAGLRPSPDWTSTGGSLTGAVYALPTLIRIYTGDRVTGTDLTTLHFGVTSDEAFLTPLCVG